MPATKKVPRPEGPRPVLDRGKNQKGGGSTSTGEKEKEGWSRNEERGERDTNWETLGTRRKAARARTPYCLRGGGRSGTGLRDREKGRDSHGTVDRRPYGKIVKRAGGGENWKEKKGGDPGELERRGKWPWEDRGLRLEAGGA